MLSLYIHIPFCKTKCPYCSFQVCPSDQMKSEVFHNEIENYTQSLISEIKHYSQILTDKEIKSIYLGWWTPQTLGLKNIEKITDTIIKYFDTENLWEFSIEMNPYPADEVLNFVEKLSSKYDFFPRVRFSFGIQSFDNFVLSNVWRDTSFPALVELFRKLQKIKKANNVFNLDFIAFGYFHKSRKWNPQLRNQDALSFFQNLANTQFVDSYSIYTLELFPGSLRYYQNNSKAKETNSSFSKILQFVSDDSIYEEFATLKDMVLDSWYKRYELSNFSLWWKSSIHNRVYREMWDYVWIWTSASSFIKSPNSELKKYLWISKDSLALRWTNTSQVANYNKWEFLDRASVQNLTEKDLLIEEFFLALRTDIWVNDLQKFSSVLVKNIDQKIDSYIQQWFVQKTSNWIVLTDPGMDIYNDIITELLEEI